MEKLAGPPGAEAPAAAAVMSDGGRFQKTTRNEDSKTHWYEYKAGFCAALAGRPDGEPAGEHAPDPIPEVPEFLLDLQQVETLTREIGKKAADVPEPDEQSSDDTARGISLDDLSGLEQLEELLPSAESPPEEPSSKKSKKLRLSPKVRRRDVVATGQNSDAFGLHLAARAWRMGLFQAERKACVGDGGSWLWTIWERWFQAFGFVPILDVIHAVTYLYAGATARRPRKEGAERGRGGLSPLDHVGLAGGSGQGHRRTCRPAARTRNSNRRRR